MIAHGPLHRSGQAELQHPAPTLGKDAQAHEKIRMTNTSRWEPSRKIALHAAPRQVVTLAPTAQNRPPQIAHCFAKSAQGRAVHGHPVIAEMAQQDRAQVRCSQSFDVVDVVQERCEPLFLILSCCLSCCLTYPLERAGRAFRALSPERVALGRVPLGAFPLLRRLRCRFLGFRPLHRFYGTVRLPASVRHRRTSFDFPIRSTVLSSADRRGISRFPNKVLAYMHGVSDRAGSWYTLRWRCTRCCLPTISTASASRSTCRLRSRAYISRLNTRPVRPPVNASTPPSRAAPHDSGPLWFASPSTHETFIHHTLPV